MLGCVGLGEMLNEVAVDKVELRSRDLSGVIITCGNEALCESTLEVGCRLTEARELRSDEIGPDHEIWDVGELSSSSPSSCS